MSSQHELTNFQTDVIERSRTTPVLVDFWAPWCGPCRMLGPVLEKLAAAAAGRWVLVKVNTDEHQDLAMQFSIRGIPDVRLFHQGEVTAEFSGALPEPHLRRWLEENLPSPTRALLGQARDLLQAGRFEEAERMVTSLQAGAPRDRDLAVLLAHARVFRAPADAIALIEGISNDEADLVRSLALVLRLRPEELPEFSARTPLLAGLAELRAGRLAEALRLLIASMEESNRYADGAARRACLAIFKHLGPHHPLTLEFSRRYSMAAT
jgi:putative thioredoxin